MHLQSCYYLFYFYISKETRLWVWSAASKKKCLPTKGNVEASYSQRKMKAQFPHLLCILKKSSKILMGWHVMGWHEKRITDMIFEFEMSFSHKQTAATTPSERARFAYSLRNQFNNAPFCYPLFEWIIWIITFHFKKYSTASLFSLVLNVFQL